MTYKDIIYSNLLRLLNTLTVDDANFEAYATGLTGDPQDDIIALNDRISFLMNELKSSRTLGNITTDFTALTEVLDILASDHPGFIIAQLDELKLIPVLIKKLQEAIDGLIDITTTTLSVDDFVLEPLKKPIKEKNFYHGDTDINESVVLIDLRDINGLLDWVNTTQISRDITAHLLAKIGSTVPLNKSQYALVHSSLTNRPGAIQSLITLHVVLNGKVIHEPETYDQPLSLPATRKILKGNEYQQFNDAISILSDYNKDSDILDKFLRLYHLIENFMYRFPLVALEAKHGNSFYIRDFQLMYEKISDSEASSLKKLMKEVFPKKYEGTTTFESHVHGMWIALTTHIAEAELNKLLTVLGFESNYAAIKKEKKQFYLAFARMIYAIRNSLVHNKDTEIHLTHESLSNHPRMGDTAAIFLRKFLMPAVASISLYLIIEDNSIVWLRNSSLELWSDS